MGHVEYSALHFLEKLPQVVMVKGQGTLGRDGGEERGDRGVTKRHKEMKWCMCMYVEASLRLVVLCVNQMNLSHSTQLKG